MKSHVFIDVHKLKLECFCNSELTERVFIQKWYDKLSDEFFMGDDILQDIGGFSSFHIFRVRHLCQDKL